MTKGRKIFELILILVVGYLAGTEMCDLVKSVGNKPAEASSEQELKVDSKQVSILDQGGNLVETNHHAELTMIFACDEWIDGIFHYMTVEDFDNARNGLDELSAYIIEMATATETFRDLGFEGRYVIELLIYLDETLLNEQYTEFWDTLIELEKYINDFFMVMAS